MDETQLIGIIEKAYEEKSTKDITEKELLEWLHRNNLTSEEANKAINAAVKQRRIRFCYLSSVGQERHVRCYEKLTKEDLEFGEELGEAMIGGSSGKDSKMRKIKAPK